MLNYKNSNMQSIVVLLCVFGLVSCEWNNTSLLDTARALAENTRIKISNSLANVSQSNETMFEIFHKLSHGHELSENELVDHNNTDVEVVVDYSWLDGEFSEDNESTTEFLGIDSNGCDRGLRKQLEERCDEEYEKVNLEAQDIDVHSQKTEALCCALEDFEKCNLRAFDKANCGGDKAAIRENMKAARLFITVVANVTCSKFRGQCVYYSSASLPIPSIAVFASILIALTKLFGDFL